MFTLGAAQSKLSALAIIDTFSNLSISLLMVCKKAKGFGSHTVIIFSFS